MEWNTDVMFLPHSLGRNGNRSRRRGRKGSKRSGKWRGAGRKTKSKRLSGRKERGGKPTAPQCKRLPRTFMKPVGGIERWTEIQTLTDLEDMFYALYEDNFQTVGDLIRHTEHELSQYANLGKSGARRITQTLQTLNMQPGLWPTVWGDSDISDQEAMLEAWREEDEAQWREEYGEWLSDIQKEQNEFAQ